MRLRCIGCDAIARPLYLCAARSHHVVDVTLLRRGLHNKPRDLRGRLQAEIDATDAGYDAVVLAYGLCGGATTGLVARELPVVMPRAHDCITVFLGSRQRYREQFERHPGTYWYVQDYLERDDGSGESLLGVGAPSDDELQQTYDEYVAKFGRENADYLMETLGAWSAHYERAGFIDLGIAVAAAVQDRARAEAARRGWIFERIAGSLDLVRRLLAGDWDGDFLVLEPGQELAMSYDDAVIKASASTGASSRAAVS
jgi:hypothetical protein